MSSVKCYICGRRIALNKATRAYVTCYLQNEPGNKIYAHNGECSKKLIDKLLRDAKKNKLKQS